MHFYHIRSQSFFDYNKIGQLESGNSDTIVWKIPPFKLVFDSAKVSRPSSDILKEPAMSFASPIVRTHPHVYNFYIKFYLYGIRSANETFVSVSLTLITGEYDNSLRWPKSKLIHIRNRYQLDPLNTWTQTIRQDQDTAYKHTTISTKK